MPTTPTVERQLDLLVDALQEISVARRQGVDAASGMLARLGDVLRATLEVIDRSESALEPLRDRRDRISALAQDLRNNHPVDRFVVRSAGRLHLVRTDEIDWIEAAGNYVRLHIGGASHLLRETMTAIEARLDSGKFLRIHRSRIVNVERVDKLQPWLNGEYAVILRTGARLTLSRGCRQKLEKRLRVNS